MVLLLCFALYCTLWIEGKRMIVNIWEETIIKLVRFVYESTGSADLAFLVACFCVCGSVALVVQIMVRLILED